jgi:hypothetical protein
MKKCWDPNPENRPKTSEICELIDLFHVSYIYNESEFKHYLKIEKEQKHYEIEKQFKEVEEHRMPKEENNRKSQLSDSALNVNDTRIDDDDDYYYYCEDNDYCDDDDGSDEENDDADIDDDDGNDDHHPQAIYISRLLNPFVKDLPKYDDSIDHNSLEIIDFVQN